MKAQPPPAQPAWKLGDLLGPGYIREDKAGRTQFDLAVELLASGRSDTIKTREKLVQEIVEAAKVLHSWDNQTVARLCLLVQMARLTVPGVLSAFKKAIRTTLQEDAQAETRGRVWRMLGALGESPLPHVIVKDQMMQNKYPWLWIDIMEPLDWQATEGTILKVLGRGPGQLQELLRRFPYLWNKRQADVEHGLRLWLPILSDDERAKLVVWLKRKNVRIPPLWDPSATRADRQFVTGALSAVGAYANSPQR